LRNPYVAPRGYRPSTGSGLLVPDAVSRIREVWTSDEWRLIDRAMRLLHSRSVKVTLTCKSDTCDDRAIQGTTEVSGDMRLRCGCKDRIVTRAF
jgi:hypothetical protein